MELFAIKFCFLELEDVADMGIEINILTGQGLLEIVKNGPGLGR